MHECNQKGLILYFFWSVLMFDISFSPICMHLHVNLLMPLLLCVKKNKTKRKGVFAVSGLWVAP